MVSLGIIVSTASGGKGVIPSIPTISHGPTAGTFVIDNYDSGLRYVTTAGTISGNTINLGTSGTVQSQIVAYTQKGVIASSGRTLERRTITSSYVQTGTTPGTCNYLPYGCPTIQGQQECCGAPSGGLCITCSGGGPIYSWVEDPTPSGFTKSYGEWWKIV